MSRIRQRLAALGAAGLVLALLGTATSAAAEDPTPTGTATATPTGTPSGRSGASTSGSGPGTNPTRPSGGSQTDTSQAKSPPEEMLVGIALTSMSPSVVTPTSTLSLSGTVTNISGAPIQNGVIRLLVHHAPLTSRSSVAQWSSGGIADVGGRILDATADLSVTLRPGASARFSIQAPADRLGLFMDFASIGITLETLGDDGSDLGTHRVGLLRTFITWQKAASYSPLKISWLLPLTGGPSSAVGGPPDAETLASAVGPGSRFRDVLTAINAAPKGAALSVAVDPSLVADLRLRSTPPRPETGSGSATGGSSSSGTPSGSGTPTGAATTSSGVQADASQTVADYLAALRSALATRRVVQLPYGDPDLMGIADARGTPLLTAATTAAGTGEASILGRDLGVRPLTDLAWPAGGWTDAATLAAAPRLGAKALVVSAASRPPTLEQTATPTGLAQLSPDLSAVLFDDVLSTLLQRTNSAPNRVLNTQRFLAETMAAVAESPDRQRTLLVLATRSFDPDPAAVQRLFSAVGQAGWIKPATLAQLRGSAGQGTVSDRQVLPVPAATKRTQLPSSQVNAVRDVRGVATQLASVIPGDTSLEQSRVDALRLVGVSWRARSGTAALRVKALDAALQARAAKVHILPLSNLNFLASDGNLTLSVSNDLAEQVRGIRLVVQPGNGRLVVVKQAAPITIDADRRTTIKVHVHAVAGGVVPVTARIVTPDGLQMGPAVTVRVHVRPTDTWAFWVLGVAAGITFLIGLVRTLRRGRARPRLVAPEVDEL